MSRFTDKTIEEKISTILDEDKKEIKGWNDSLGLKILLILPSFLFLVSFLIANPPKDLNDLIALIIYPIFFIFFGVVLLFLMEK